MDDFEEYYKWYLSKHKSSINRAFHLIGNICTILYVIAVLYFDLSLLWLFLTPFVVYPFAWTGHLVFEGNIPAFFKGSIRKKIYAKISDWRMMYDWFRGRI